MITAHFNGNSFIINLSNIDKKYLGKKIIFKLNYGLEVIGDSESEQYRKVKSKSLIFNGEKELILEIDEVRSGYRGKKLFIGYYLEVDLGTKFLLFRDSKEIDITGREDSIYFGKDLNIISGKYRDVIDEVSVSDVLSSLSSFTKIIMSLFLVGGIILIFLFFTMRELVFGFLGVLLLIMNFIIYKFSGSGYINIDLGIDEVLRGDDLSKIIKGKFTKDLDEVFVELFALNTEEAHFVHQDGSTTRFVDFDIEIGNILLFSKKIENIKAGDKIGKFLKGELNLDEVYKNLFPTLSVSTTRGLFTKLEIRISNKKLRDITLRKRILLDNDKFIKNKKTKNINKNKINIDSDNLNSDFFS